MSMQQSTRLIVNTLATYVRMVLTVGLGLLTTRIVYAQLGETDFGVQSVVGASGSLLLIFSDALVGSAQRHLAFHIGRGDTTQLRVTFNSSLLLFGIAALLMALVGSACGPALLYSLQIPSGREQAASLALALTIGVLVITCATTPFRAAFTAHQSIVVASVLDVLASLLFLVAAFLLLILPGDKLVVHSLLVSLATIFVMGVSVVLCLRTYPLLRPSFAYVSPAGARGMIGFASWGFLGSACWRLFMQGASIALNVFFGPIANAGYAVASQVSSYQMNLAAPIPKATESAIVSLEARQEREAVKRLVLLCSKYQSVITLFFLVPFAFEATTILSLWLKAPPHYATELVRWVLLASWASTLTTGHQQSVIAHGSGLGRYTLLLAGTNLAALAIAVSLFIRGGIGPVALPATAALLTLLSAPVLAWYAGSLIDLPVAAWIRSVVIPNVFVGLVAGAAAGVAHFSFAPGLARIFAVTVAFAIPASVIVWVMVLDADERSRFLRFARAGCKLMLPAAAALLSEK
jgi:O-antigen/teichoic acid export membrane protein